MTDDQLLAAAFEDHRARLRAVAYRLLGSFTDAEDAVQETWLRLSTADTDDVENLRAWLTTVVARVSLNMLRSRRNRREQPVGDAWPDAAVRAAGAGGIGARSDSSGADMGRDPVDEAVLADSVGLALLVVLDTLTPAERLAFVLHDMFAMPFVEVAAVLGGSTAAARQLASRARRRVRGISGGPSADRAVDVVRQREVAAAFLAASRNGNLGALIALLDADVTLRADAVASPSGKPAVLRGSNAVARGAVLSSGRADQSRLAVVDGSVGIVFAPAGHLQVVLALTVSPASTITVIEVIADPGRLRGLRLALLPE